MATLKHHTGYERYAQDVCNGKQVAGQYIKLAVERYYRFREKYEFREDVVDRVIDFISHMKLTAGKFKNKPFILQPWQEFAVANIFGFYDPDTGKRVTQNVFMLLARKSGKTQFIAAIALYCLVADGESMAEVPILSNAAKQAHILFDMSKMLVNDLDPKHKHFIKLRDSIKYPKTNSVMQVLASDTTNLDGYNPSCFILDEVHEYKDSKIYDVMVSGQGMRENPLAIQITTAGFDITGYCYSYRKMCTDVLRGLAEDDGLFSLIYELDKDDQWDDPNVWIKAQPNLDITVTSDWMAKQVQKAKNNTILQTSVKTKNLNIWQADSVNQWLPNILIEGATEKIEWEFYKDKITYIGIDLSAVSDLTSGTYLVKDGDDYYFKTKYYLPEEALKDPNNGAKYMAWWHEKHLILTPGNVTDYDYILKDMLELQNIGMIVDSISYDSYNATQFAINATAAGLPMKPYPQALYSFNKPTREFERLLRLGRVHIDYNPITTWCFSNAVLKTDWNNNVKPIKKTGQTGDSSYKIDGAITITEALGGYLNSPNAMYSATDSSL